jgi:flagellar biosynthetic protein FliQ
LDPETVIDILRSAMGLVMFFVLVIVLPGLLISLLVNFFQSITSIQDQALSFIPKLIVTFVTLIVCGSWLLYKLVHYTHDIFDNIFYWIG